MDIQEERNHKFLAEETLVPFVNHTDAGRLNMFSSHAGQHVVLIHPDIPSTFSGFENQIGEISSGYKATKESVKIISVIPRSSSFYTIVTKNEKEEFDIVNISSSTALTESYGYLNRFPSIDTFYEGQELPKDTVLNAATCFDDYNNLMYGVNLKACYYPHEGLTFEDAIVLSESAAEKLSHASVTEYLVPVNSNDILLNVYGDKDNYKPFPDIGEDIKDGILCSRRRMVNNMMLSSLNNKSLAKITSSDSSYFSHGYIDDIFVYCNRNIDEEVDPYMKQIIKYAQAQREYDRKLVEVLFEASERGALSSDAAYYFNRSRDSLDANKKWLAENSFDNVIIKFRVVNIKKAMVASKITNRYGGKGVVSAIVPNDKMPVTEDGRYSEVCLNYAGVPNRLNWGCLFEHETNFIVSEVIERSKDKNYEEKEEILLDILSSFNYSQKEHFENFINNLSQEERNDFIDEIYTKGSMPIHMAPFFDNCNLEELMLIYEHFGVSPLKFRNIENKIVLADMYFIKLKHEPTGKLSARSCGNINIKGVPNKTNRNFRAGMAPYSTTPIRLGEQELLNLLLANDPGAVMEMLDFHSSNKEDREALISKMLTKASDEEICIEEGKFSTVKEILKAYFSAIGLLIAKTEKDDFIKRIISEEVTDEQTED
jgi:DNA-directed RNA polymerase beta subunit